MKIKTAACTALATVSLFCCPLSEAAKPLGSWFNDTHTPSYHQNRETRALINRIIGTAGGRGRWSRIQNLIITSNTEFFDLNGNEELKETRFERTILKNTRGCYELSNLVKMNDKEIVYTTNQHDTWVTVDGHLVKNDEVNETCLRRLREIWFWSRYPFSLKDRGIVARIAGKTVINGGRTSVTLLDILPAQQGDLWPNGFIRLLINEKNHLTEGVIYPRTRNEYSNLRAEFSNLVSVQGVSLPHTREIYNEEGLIARETITGRTYNGCIPERYFQKPAFEVW